MWIKGNNIFPKFSGWQNGYSAFTYHVNQKKYLIEYVKDQRKHHKQKSFIDELKDLYKEYGINYDEKFLI